MKKKDLKVEIYRLEKVAIDHIILNKVLKKKKRLKILILEKKNKVKTTKSNMKRIFLSTNNKKIIYLSF